VKKGAFTGRGECGRNSVCQYARRALSQGDKTKSAFVINDAVLKQLYLVTMQVMEQWTMPIKNWGGSILMQLMIFFGNRVTVLSTYTTIQYASPPPIHLAHILYMVSWNYLPSIHKTNKSTYDPLRRKGGK